MHKKIVAVVGATGAQGGGLARAILADREGGFAVRALTRRPISNEAFALARLGAEVVAADLDDPSSLRRAFAGAHGAFCITNFWKHASPEKELAQAKAMARAAEEAGVAHTIWSTLEDTRTRIPLDDARMPTLLGRYKVPHFDAKGEADAFFIDRVPTTLLRTSFCWDDLIHFGMGPKPMADGTLGFALPMADEKLPGIAAEDVGACAYGVFRRGGELVGKTVGIAGEHLTGAEMAQAFERALERAVVYRHIEPDVYRTFGFPGADALANMFQYSRDFAAELCGARDVGFSRALHHELSTFSGWLSRNRSRIALT